MVGRNERQPIQQLVYTRLLWRLYLAASVALFAGCGPRSVAGGTPGRLRAGADVLAEIQVTIHRGTGASREIVGFGITADDGTFALRTPGARGPLRLPKGQYRITVESVGNPIQLPAELLDPQSTPWRLDWSPIDGSLELDLDAVLRLAPAPEK